VATKRRGPRVYSVFDPPPKVGQAGGTIGADQSFKAECDINRIVKRYQETGTLPALMGRSPRVPFFADVSVAPEDFFSSQLLVSEANDAFMQLPARVRERFGNSPGALLEFLADPANAEEAVSMGLAAPPEPNPPVGEVAGPPPGGQAPEGPSSAK